MNQFAHIPAFPDATYSDVVRPNVDTLYSLMWFDVSQGPLLISVPDPGGRYYLLQMCDMWTDVFDSPGTRTTGSGPQVLAIAGSGWQGQLPADATLIHSPRLIGWVLGRTQTDGKADYDAVRRFQAGLNAIPLSQWGKPYRPPAGKSTPIGRWHDPLITWQGLGRRRISRSSPSSRHSTRRTRTTTRSSTRCGVLVSSRASLRLRQGIA